MKTKAITFFLVPTVALYSASASLLYGSGAPLFDLTALKTTAAMSVLCALAQDILPRSFKEAIVFWRLRDRIPGHRAFLRRSTDRYDLARITNESELAQLPPDKQQLVFYRIYGKHRHDPTVAHYSFRYVAWRDTASLLLLLAILTAPIAYITATEIGHKLAWHPILLLVAGAVIGYVLTALAARQAANGLIGQVLSCETAESPHGIDC